mmetsp:Transcript_50482/g.98930  ORF Transcript_50482/g.98930 Transcript_50482/m.98930 type:complete len:520 (-) Transcript_50482:69-1628(-)
MSTNMLVVLLTFLVSTSAAYSTPALDGIDAATFDYLVQDVCEDPHTGATSDPYGCPPEHVRRNLEIGEPLLYHKHDKADGGAGPIYQISDAFPLRHGDGTVRVVHSLDFARHGSPVQNLSFVQFDPNYDGFNINQFNTSFASIVGTADPSGGVQYFIAAKSRASSRLGTSSSKINCSVLDSWGLWNKEEVFGTSSNGSGATLFKLNIVRDTPPSAHNFSCPPFYNDAFTTYSLQQNLTFASGKTFHDVLVQQHWAGADSASAGSAEKEFFTSEYGLTRWEAWVRHPEPPLRPSTFCDGEEKKAPGGWVMVDCRDWSFTSLDPDGGYVPYRFPTPSYLLAGGNLLDNGDLGRGLTDAGMWSRVTVGLNATSFRVGEELSGNLYLAFSSVVGTGKGAAVVYQNVTASNVEASSNTVAFGFQLWWQCTGRKFGSNDVAGVSLVQIDAAGRQLGMTSVAGVAPEIAPRKKSYQSKAELLQGCTTLQLKFWWMSSSAASGPPADDDGSCELALDNAWLSPVDSK